MAGLRAVVLQRHVVRCVGMKVGVLLVHGLEVDTTGRGL